MQDRKYESLELQNNYGNADFDYVLLPDDEKDRPKLSIKHDYYLPRMPEDDKSGTNLAKSYWTMSCCYDYPYDINFRSVRYCFIAAHYQEECYRQSLIAFKSCCGSDKNEECSCIWGTKVTCEIMTEAMCCIPYLLTCIPTCVLGCCAGLCADAIHQFKPLAPEDQSMDFTSMNAADQYYKQEKLKDLVLLFNTSSKVFRDELVTKWSVSDERSPRKIAIFVTLLMEDKKNELDTFHKKQTIAYLNERGTCILTGVYTLMDNIKNDSLELIDFILKERTSKFELKWKFAERVAKAFKESCVANPKFTSEYARKLAAIFAKYGIETEYSQVFAYENDRTNILTRMGLFNKGIRGMIAEYGEEQIPHFSAQPPK